MDVLRFQIKKTEALVESIQMELAKKGVDSKSDNYRRKLLERNLIKYQDLLEKYRKELTRVDGKYTAAELRDKIFALQREITKHPIHGEKWKEIRIELMELRTRLAGLNRGLW